MRQLPIIIVQFIISFTVIVMVLRSMNGLEMTIILVLVIITSIGISATIVVLSHLQHGRVRLVLVPLV